MKNGEVTEDTNGWPDALLLSKLSMKMDLSSALSHNEQSTKIVSSKLLSSFVVSLEAW